MQEENNKEYLQNKVKELNNIESVQEKKKMNSIATSNHKKIFSKLTREIAKIKINIAKKLKPSVI